MSETPLRVALVYQGFKAFEDSFSGVPAGIAGGLRELGHVPVPVRAATPVPVERALRSLSARSRAIASADREIGLVRSAITRRRIRRLGPFDAIVQLATGFVLAPHPRIATYEDMTVRQAIAGDRAYSELPPRMVAAWIDRQRESYARARACLTISEWAARSIVEEYGVEQSRVHPVGAGRGIDPQPVDRDWSVPRFLFVGLDWERKNGAGVLRAFRELRRAVPAARLDIAGSHPPLDEPGVVCHGRLSTSDPDQRRALVGLFENATCFVMPSFAEPFGMVYSEAGAAGVPSIGTIRGGAPDAVGDGGVCVDPSDDAALLAAMRRFANGEEARAAGARALARRDETTWAAVAARLLDRLGLIQERTA